MSFKPTSPLLNINTNTTNCHNNTNYQSYHDEMPSIEIHRQSMSTKSKSSSIGGASTLSPYSSNSSQRPGQHPDSCKVCIGRILKQCQPAMKWLKRTYYVLLCNSVIICVLLIISRIFSHDMSAKDNLFHSHIFMSDSPPLLLSANIVMMISYSLENFLALRICLAIGCSCFALWGLTSQPMLLDTTMFNSVMMLLNVRHAIILSYHHRHIEFEQCWEQIYVQVFKGYLNRVDFNKLVDISYKRKLKKGEIFKRKDDEITSLCCLVSGRMKVVREVAIEPISPMRNNGQRLGKVKSVCVSAKKQISQYDDMDRKYSLQLYDRDIAYFLRDPHFVNLVHKNQFIEAPQWVHANLKPRGHRFSVSFVAVDDCEYIKWPKENVISLIEQNSNIYHALSGVLGLHTAHALLKSREYTKIQQELSQHKNTIETLPTMDNDKKDFNESMNDNDVDNNNDNTN